MRVGAAQQQHGTPVGAQQPPHGLGKRGAGGQQRSHIPHAGQPITQRRRHQQAAQRAHAIVQTSQTRAVDQQERPAQPGGRGLRGPQAGLRVRADH